MKRRINLLISSVSVVFLIATVPALGQKSITAGELKDHVYYLASPELQGRLPGTAGDQAAARYIRDGFKKSGLAEFATGGFQSFRVTTGIRRGSGNRLVIEGVSGVPDKDFMPMSISSNGQVAGSLAFAGYGFKISTDSLVWNDFEGLDCRGKVVILLLGAPEPRKGGEDPFESQASLRARLLNARDAGAAGVLLVAGPAYDEKDELEFGSIRENSAGLPVLRVRRSFIDKVLTTQGFNTAEAEKRMNETFKPYRISLGANAEIAADVVVETAQTQNVVAYLPAGSPSAKNEYIVIGAHYDHLGMGGPGSSSRVQDTVAVHSGADDNASGVAMVMELAGALSARQAKLDRNIIFVAFAGEEMGLLGSKYFVEHSPVPIGNITAMFNFDMVGRPNEENRITISGTGTAVEIDSLLNQLNTATLSYSRSPEGYGPSDHAAFYSAGIPVFYFSTGAHLDYHTPGDSPEKLNYGIMKVLGDQIESLVVSVANMPSRLTYREAGPKAAESGRRKLKVTLGIMPDVSGTENNGLRVEFATPGKPAQLAGILKGDIITGINGLPITNVYDYMSRLQTLKSGQIASVELVRQGKKLVVLVQL